MKKYIIFDFSGTLVKMRPPKLLVDNFLLEKLSKRAELCIITGARRTETLNILDKLNIKRLFCMVITKDDSKFRKPNAKLFPKGKITVYIGDTKRDQIFAKNGKVPFFRVNNKYNINQILKKLYE